MNRQLNINWQDGMKINKAHFIHGDRASKFNTSESISALFPHNLFGIIAPNAYCNNTYRLSIIENKLIIHNLYLLNGLGSIGYIEEDEGLQINLSELILKESESIFLVALSFSIMETIPSGSPDANEIPVRQPYIKPKYNLGVLTTHTTLNMNDIWFPIARIKKTGHYFELDSSYIPPSICVDSIPILKIKFDNLVHLINDIGKYAIEVANKARSKKRQGEINDLSESAFYFFEKIVFYISERNHQFTSKNTNNIPPSRPIYFANGLARIMLVALKCLKSENKEYLLRYFESHLGIAPHKLEEHLYSICDIDYDHYNISDNYSNIENFLSFLKNLLYKARDLEFHSIDAPIVETETKILIKPKKDIF